MGYAERRCRRGISRRPDPTARFMRLRCEGEPEAQGFKPRESRHLGRLGASFRRLAPFFRADVALFGSDRVRIAAR
ncbi:MAG: hypothetical protein D6771_09280 [Zetaproteobacteria bacterium]|nr:MAG: hypothetical protein D6771_09280 [Zetaproteobacteria bacterium]